MTSEPQHQLLDTQTLINVIGQQVYESTQHMINELIVNNQEKGNIYHRIIGAVQKSMVEAAMDSTSIGRKTGNQSDASKLLGKNRATVRTIIKRFDIEAMDSDQRDTSLPFEIKDKYLPF